METHVKLHDWVLEVFMLGLKNVIKNILLFVIIIEIVNSLFLLL